MAAMGTIIVMIYLFAIFLRGALLSLAAHTKKHDQATYQLLPAKWNDPSNFHPASVWIGNRLTARQERNCTCDDKNTKPRA